MEGRSGSWKWMTVQNVKLKYPSRSTSDNGIFNLLKDWLKQSRELTSKNTATTALFSLTSVSILIEYLIDQETTSFKYILSIGNKNFFNGSFSPIHMDQSFTVNSKSSFRQVRDALYLQRYSKWIIYKAIHSSIF